MNEQELNSLIVKLDLAKEYKKKAKSQKEQLKYELIEQELSDRLCRCIKKVQAKNNTKSASIAICTKSVFSNRGLKRSSFTCKDTPKLYPTKGSQYGIKKMPIPQSGLSVRQGNTLKNDGNQLSGLKVIELRKLAKKQGIQLTRNKKYKTKEVLIKELIEQKGGSARENNTLILLEKKINKLLNEYCMKIALKNKQTNKNVNDAIKYIKQNIKSTDKRIERIAREIAIYKFDFLDSDN